MGKRLKKVKKLLLLLLIICTSSCIAPYSSYDYAEPTRYMYYPTYQPTRTIIVKHKHKRHNKSNKRHVKVKINKHRKTK